MSAELLCYLVTCDTLSEVAQRLDVSPRVLSRYLQNRHWLAKRAYHFARSVAFARYCDMLQPMLDYSELRQREQLAAAARRVVALQWQGHRWGDGTVAP